MNTVAIVTKFLGPTNNRGSRVKATLPSGKSITMEWSHEWNAEQNHINAARKAYRTHILGYNITGENFQKSPHVISFHEIHGHKSGYVCLVKTVEQKFISIALESN